MSKENLVIVEHCSAITCITLNRPQKRNALSTALLEQFCQAIHETVKMPTQRALVITGNGPAFCAGMDLQEAAQPESINPLANLIAKALTALYTSPLVTIAAVNGAAVAGGAGLMSACDFAMAAADAKIGYPEIKHGLVAAQVATLLVRQIPWRKVRQLLLLGEMIDAEEALKIGLISHIVPKEDVLSQALKLAQQAAKNTSEAVNETKRLLTSLEPHAFIDDLRIAINIHRKARRSHAASAGVSAFLNKRTAKQST